MTTTVGMRVQRTLAVSTLERARGQDAAGTQLLYMFHNVNLFYWGVFKRFF